MAPNLYSQEHSFYKAKEKLEVIEEQHLLKYWDTLDEKQQKLLLEEIDNIDINSFVMQQKVLNTKGQGIDFSVQPFHNVTSWQEGTFEKKGIEALQQGKVGVAIVAGGQGTRFGYHGPKGCFPISYIKEKTLFQLFAEKVLYASKMVGVDLPLAIMTSSNNHDTTVNFFAEHQYFGLKEEQVHFFQQADLPFVSNDGHMFLQSVDSIAKGPNGNGAFFEHFVGSGIWEKWKSRGVEIISFILIDNPLADPFDLELIGNHYTENNEVTVKCISRIDPYEKVGVIVADEEQKPRVLEYSEIEENQRTAKDQNGDLLHQCANISLFCFDMDFVKVVAENCTSFLPYHLAYKAATYVNEDGESVRSKEPIANKYERFIFDMLPFTSKVSALMYPREICFAPLKNPAGKNSPQTVEKALLEQDRKQWKKIAGTKAPSHEFELSQEFYFPTDDFINQWKGVEAPDIPYID